MSVGHTNSEPPASIRLRAVFRSMVEALNFPHMGEHYHGWLFDRSDVACVSTIARKVMASACRHSRKRIGILTTHTRPPGGPAPAA